MTGISISAQRLLDMNLFSIAQAYNLNDKKDRLRSATDLKTFFFRIVREISPDLFIEAGAKDATTSLVVHKHLPEARIVAFEANPATHRRFAEYHDDSPIEYVYQALNDTEGDVPFNVMTRGDVLSADGRGSLLTPTEENVSVLALPVPAQRLDSLFPPNQFDKCCLWVDVEGAVRNVLHGARWLLPKVEALYIEVEDRPAWKDQWLSSDVVNHLWQNGLVPVARDFQSRYQYNMVFVRKELLNDARIRLFLAEYRSFAVYPPTGAGG